MNLDKPIVSIITVTRNAIESGRMNMLIQSLKSVKRQSYPYVEHLIIDGASTDGTTDLLKKYERRGWIKLYSEVDSGMYDARNKGVNLASGKYVGFLNDDDFYNNRNAVKESISLLEKKDADFSYGDTLIQKKDSQKVRKGNLTHFLYAMPFGELTMFVKASVLRKEGGFNIEYGLPADYDLVIRLILKNYKSVRINSILGTYRYGGATDQSIKEYRSNIAHIYMDNYSPFYIFKDEQEAIDFKYKHIVPEEFIEKYLIFANKNLTNLNNKKVLRNLKAMSVS